METEETKEHAPPKNEEKKVQLYATEFETARVDGTRMTQLLYGDLTTVEMTVQEAQIKGAHAPQAALDREKTAKRVPLVIVRKLPPTELYPNGRTISVPASALVEEHDLAVFSDAFLKGFAGFGSASRRT